MSNPYSIRIGKVDFSDASNHVIGTVPANKRWVVVDISVWQGNTGSAGARVGSLTPAGGTDGVALTTPALAVNTGLYVSERRYVLDAGYQLIAVSILQTGTYRLVVTVSGYELDVP